jgi:hypothetical protein
MRAETIAGLVASGAIASLLDSLAAVLTVVYGGAILLTLALALAVRFAVPPLLEALAHTRRGGAVFGGGHEGGTSALEADLVELRRTVAALADGLEFDRQLSRRRGLAPPLHPGTIPPPDTGNRT